MILEFYLKTREAVEAKYAEMIGYGYEAHGVPHEVGGGMYFALLNDPDGLHKVTWVDVRTAVQLAARWPERPDPRADRMLLVWTDRQLQKLVEAQALRKPKKK